MIFRILLALVALSAPAFARQQTPTLPHLRVEGEVIFDKAPNITQTITKRLNLVERADVWAGTGLIDLAPKINAALNDCSGGRQQIRFTAGVYSVQGPATGTNHALYANTCPVDIWIDDGAEIRLTGSLGGTAAIDIRGLLVIGPNAAGSTIAGFGTINGNRAALAAAYVALPTAPAAVGGIVSAAQWSCILATTAHGLKITGIKVRNCIGNPIEVRNTNDFELSNVAVSASSMAINIQNGARHKISNFTATDITNKVGSVALPVWAYGAVISDIDGLDVSGFSIDNFEALLCTAGTLSGTTCTGGTHIGDPQSGAMMLIRVKNLSLNGVRADGYIHSDPRSSPVNYGISCDACTNGTINGVQVFQHYYGLNLQAARNVTVSGCSLDGDYNTEAASGFTAATGLQIINHGHIPFGAQAVVDSYNTMGAQSLSISSCNAQRFTHGAVVRTGDFTLSNSTFNGNENVGLQLWASQGSASFLTPNAPAVKNIVLSNILTMNNGGNGIQFNDGVDILCSNCMSKNNGQRSGVTGKSFGIELIAGGGTKSNIRFSGWAAIDDQSYTKADYLSFIPGTVPANGLYTFLVPDDTTLRVGQNVLCKSCASGPADVSLYVRDITDNRVTAGVTPGTVLTDAACLTSLTGTVSGANGGTTITGSGTAFGTAIVGPVFLKTNAGYNQVNSVQSNTALITHTALAGAVSGSASLVQCDAQGVPSQTVGFRAISDASIANLSIGSPATYRVSGNTTSQIDVAPGSLSTTYTSWTPTFTPVGGSGVTFNLGAANYQIRDKSICLNLSVQVNYSTAPTGVTFTFPLTPAGTQIRSDTFPATIVGMNQSTLAPLNASFNANATAANLRAMPGATGSDVLVTASGQFIGLQEQCFRITQ